MSPCAKSGRRWFLISLTTSKGATQLCPREAEQEIKNKRACRFHPCVWPLGCPADGPGWRQRYFGPAHCSLVPGKGSWWACSTGLQPVIVQLLTSYPHPRNTDYPSAQSTSLLPSDQASQKAARTPQTCPDPTQREAKEPLHWSQLQPMPHPCRSPSSTRPVFSPT